MTVRKAAELFGDDGANGPRVPIDTAAPRGYGENNRGVGFGEGLTSMVANRLGYALALNQDDLEARLSVYETGGLDTVYRKGLANVPGGGRFITIDGGALEARSTASASYAGDRANAQVRARVEAATTDGISGYDFVGRAGGAADPATGRAGFGYMDRRAVVFTGPRTNLAFTATGTLNANGVGRTTLTVLSPGYFSSSQGTDLLAGIDLIEILDSAYAGVYVLGDAANTTRVTLLRFDGQTPNFPPNTAVTFRLYRPIFQSAAGKVGSQPLQGARFVALAGDTDVPALSLVQPGAGYLLSAHNKGAARVFSVDVGGSVVTSGAVTASAGLNAASLTVSGDVTATGSTSLVKAAKGEFAGELRAGSLVLTSGVVTAGNVGGASSIVTAMAFKGGTYEGTTATLSGALTAQGVTIPAGKTLSLQGGSIVLDSGGDISLGGYSTGTGGRVLARTITLSQKLEAASASVSGQIDAAALTASGNVTFGTVGASPASAAVVNGTLDVKRDVTIRSGASLTLENGTVYAAQYSFNPLQTHDRPIPLAKWRALAGANSGGFYERFYGWDGNSRAHFWVHQSNTGSVHNLLIPISGSVEWTARVTQIKILYRNFGHPIPPTAELELAKTDGTVVIRRTGNLNQVSAAGDIFELTWTFSYSGSGSELQNQMLVLREIDPVATVNISQSGVVPYTNNKTVDVLACIVTFTRSAIT